MVNITYRERQKKRSTDSQKDKQERNTDSQKDSKHRRGKFVPALRLANSSSFTFCSPDTIMLKTMNRMLAFCDKASYIFRAIDFHSAHGFVLFSPPMVASLGIKPCQSSSLFLSTSPHATLTTAGALTSRSFNGDAASVHRARRSHDELDVTSESDMCFLQFRIFLPNQS